MSSVSSALNNSSRQDLREENPVIPPPLPADFKLPAKNQNEEVPPIEKKEQMSFRMTLKLEDKEIPILPSSKLHAMIEGKMEGGYNFDKAEGENTIIVINPQGEELGRVPLDSRKDLIEIRADLLKGLDKVFDAEGIEVNEDVNNKPQNRLNLNDIDNLREEFFKK